MLAGNDRDTIIGKPGKLTGLPKFDSHVEIRKPGIPPATGFNLIVLFQNWISYLRLYFIYDDLI